MWPQMQVRGSNFQGSNTRLKHEGDIIWESTEIYDIFNPFFPLQIKIDFLNC